MVDTVPAYHLTGWWNDPKYEYKVGREGPEYIESTAQDLLQRFIGVPNNMNRWLKPGSVSMEVKDIEISEVDVVNSELFRAARTSDEIYPRPNLGSSGGEGPAISVTCRIGRNPLKRSADICILDFLGEVRSQFSTSAHMTPLGARPGEHLEKAFSNSLKASWARGSRAIDFGVNRGRNAVRCAVFVTYKSPSKVSSQFTWPAPEAGPKAYRTMIGSFSVFPFDNMRDKDDEGFVKIPVYFHIDNERGRGWKTETSALFFQNAGKFQGWIKVKIDVPEVPPSKEASRYPRPDQRLITSVPTLLRKPGDCPLVFAHRGVIDQDQDVENSGNMAQKAYYNGADGIEGDVFMVAKDLSVFPDFSVEKRSTDYENDYELVLSHDGDLTRLLGIIGRSTGRGDENEIVTQFTVASLRSIERFLHCEIAPPLTSVFPGLRTFPLLMDLDTKPNNPTKPPWPTYSYDLGVKLGNVIRAHGVEKRVVVTGFSPDVIRAVATTQGPTKILTGITTWKGMDGVFLRILDFFKDVSKYESARLCSLESMCSDGEIKKLHSKGAPVGSYILYDVNESPTSFSYSKKALELALKTDWIETDDVARTAHEVRTSGCNVNLRD